MLVQKNLQPLVLLLLCSLLLQCVEPVEPEFRLRDGFLLIDGKLSTAPGSSRLFISRATVQGDQFLLNPIRVNKVCSVRDDGSTTEWSIRNVAGDNLIASYYAPPEGYTPQAGRRYHLQVISDRGEVFESDPEELLAPPSEQSVEVVFEQESFFSDQLNRFVPAFEFKTSFQDPAETVDNYRFTFRGWEGVQVCLRCTRSRANPNTQSCDPALAVAGVPYFDYACNMDCFQPLNYPVTTLLSDVFVNGNPVNDFVAGKVNYDWFGPILVIQDMERLNPRAFEYYRVLQEQTLNSGGLNTTLPANLVGNVNAVGDTEEAVLGYFGVVGAIQERIFFDRDALGGTPLPFNNQLNFEPPPPPPGAPYTHPCDGIDRTSERPLGWPE